MMCWDSDMMLAKHQVTFHKYFRVKPVTSVTDGLCVHFPLFYTHVTLNEITISSPLWHKSGITLDMRTSQTSVVQEVDSTIHGINHYVLPLPIQAVVICSLDSAIQPLNNWRWGFVSSNSTWISAFCLFPCCCRCFVFLHVPSPVTSRTVVFKTITHAC